jgi:hypothetical protein
MRTGPTAGTALSQRLHVPGGSPTVVPSFINPSALPSHDIHSPNRQGLRLATASCYTVTLPRNLTLSISRYHGISYGLVQCSPDIVQKAPNANAEHALALQSGSIRCEHLPDICRTAMFSRDTYMKRRSGIFT